MIFKPVLMTKEIEKDPTLAVKQVKNGVAVWVNPIYYEKLVLSQKKGKKYKDTDFLAEIIPYSFIQHNGYVLVEIDSGVGFEA